MTEIKKQIARQFDILRAVALATYKEWAAYRSHVMVSLFVGPVYFLVQVYIWKAVYASGGSINGLSLEQIISYFGIAALINYIIYDSADWNLQMLVHTGKFTTFLLKPMSHLYFAFSQKMGHRILGILFEFVPVYLVFVMILGIAIVPAYPAWALISVFLGFVMMFLVNYCIGIFSFWLIKTSGIRRMFLLIRDVCSGVMIPLTFFPGILQKILFFMPFQFIAYVPVRVCIGTYELGGVRYGIPAIVGIQAAAVILMILFSACFFRMGVKRFTGVGA